MKELNKQNVEFSQNAVEMKLSLGISYDSTSGRFKRILCECTIWPVCRLACTYEYSCVCAWNLVAKINCTRGARASAKHDANNLVNMFQHTLIRDMPREFEFFFWFAYSLRLNVCCVAVCH